MGNTIAVDEVDIRGPVSEVINEKLYILDSQDFPGFYYDADEGLGKEMIKMRITEGNILREDSGVNYETTVEPEEFEFKEWGNFLSIGFLGEKYFAGYAEDSKLHDERGGSLISLGSLSRVLIDSSLEGRLVPGMPLKLEEGYELSLEAANNDVAYVILSKEGTQVDSKIVNPNNEAQSTYAYRVEIGGSGREIALIAVHFKNCFSSSSSSIASYDAIFQISDKFKDVQEGKSYGNMSVKSSKNDKIILTNIDDIPLTRNKDIPLMGDFWIRTADQGISSTEPLRFCIYKRAFEPGDYIIRGPIAPILNSEQDWDAEKFSGFYYDINNNIKSETIRFLITGDRQLEASRGIEYSTYTREVPFKFSEWGQFFVIGFLGEKYFVSYAKSGYIANESNNGNLMSNGQLSKVLIDSKKEVTILENNSLWLQEGYMLTIKSIDVNGNKANVELHKDGRVLDSKIVSPSIENATLKDSTYYYKRNIGDFGNITVVAIHFKDAFKGAAWKLCTVDGVWQISEQLSDIKVGTKYGKMKIISSENEEIVMNNEDHITLSRKSQPLMGKIAISASDEDPRTGRLRMFNLYKEETIERSYPIGPNDVVYPSRKGLA